MASRAEELALSADEFAFYFRSDKGVEAHELGIFLQRAATVARQQRVDLLVIATRSGSLAVILKALRKEFKKAPAATTAAGMAVVGPIVAAIVYAMSPHSGQATPLAKAGSELIEQSHVEQIEVVTINETIVVMDEDRAREIREIERRNKRQVRSLPAPQVQELIEYARKGALDGAVVDVEGELHFRPDGYRYLVPIDIRRSDVTSELYGGSHIRVSAEILTHRGQPDSIVIHEAHPV
jgi:hypothetical protein